MFTAFVLLIIFVAFFTQAIIGFGGGLIAIPLLSLFLLPTDAVTIVLIFQICMVILAIKDRYKIDFSVIKKISIGTIVGCILGVFLIDFLAPDTVRLALGVFVLLYVLKDVSLKVTALFNKIATLPAIILGGGAGAIQGAFGMGGPLYVVYFNQLILDKTILRSTLIATFFVANTVRLIVSFSSNMISLDLLFDLVFYLPVFAVSLWLGNIMHTRLSQAFFRRLMQFMLIVSSLSLLVKAALGFLS